MWPFARKKPVNGNTRIFMPDDAAPSLTRLEERLSELYQLQPLLSQRDKLEKIVLHELSKAHKSIADPATNNETVQLYRGAFWLWDKIEEKLDYLEKDIELKEKQLDEERKKQDADVGVGIVETAVR